MDEIASRGYAALAAEQWETARKFLGEAVGSAASPAPELVDALAEAQWWCGAVEDALASREVAATGWAEQGDTDRAVRAAVWIAVEYASGLGNEPVANGWLARATTMANAPGAHAAAGWVALANAALTADPLEQVRHAEMALALAREKQDAELEVFALARLGWARVVTGAVDRGIDLFDEAMAMATTADFERLSALGDLCCQLARATEAAGERGRFGQWLSVVQRLNSEHRYPPLVGFCATCCAELVSGDGNWSGAEAHLRQAIEQLRGTGHRARCGPPVAKLAELLVLQGRIEEASDLVAGDTGDDTLVARARLALANGQAAVARRLAERWVRRRGDDLLAVGALAIAGQAAVAEENFDLAVEYRSRIDSIGEQSGNRRALGTAALLTGDIELARGERQSAAESFELALDLLAGLDGVLDAASAHLGLAETTRDTDADVARTEAKAALAGFESANALHLAARAAAMLRDLGDRSHVGRKTVGLLTVRELEVLRLVAQGLTNAEIAQRLFVSVKTAGNHVSNILTKTGARTRTEAAAFAAAHPEVMSGS